MPDVDLAIVGAGPAGTAAAITAAREGAHVAVIDRARFPREKCCGDGLTALALRLLEELGYSPATEGSWVDVDTVHLRSTSGRLVDLQLPADGRYAAVVRRRELDNDLVELADSAGAMVIDGVGVSGIRGADAASSQTTLELANGTHLTSRWVVAADGMWSPVRKLLGLSTPGYRGEWHAFRQYVHASGPASRELWVWFEPDLAPGYAWSFPLAGGVVNVGYGIVRDDHLDGGELKRIWAGLLERPHIAEVLGATEPDGPHRAWPIPARVHDTTLGAGRVLFAGDAAAVTDPMTGEGIGQALETGIAAAQSVLGGGPPGTVQARYDHRVRSALQTDHRFAGALSKLLARPRITAAAIRAVDLNDWTRRNFARWMFEDYPRAALMTPRRWRRGLFSSPGAYAGAGAMLHPTSGAH